MQSVVPFETDSVLTRGHRFVVNLIATPGHAAQVRSCEVMGPRYRNRFTFPTQAKIEEVFVSDLAGGISHCLASLSNTTEVVSLPTVSIEIPGLTLAKAHVMAARSDDGVLSVILRFKLLLGSITHAFRPELGVEDSVHDHSANMSALVLTDIVMPLLDLCTTADSGGLVQSEAFEDFMNTLIDRSQDVRFQAELIKRFVASTTTETADVAPRRVATGRASIELVR